MSTYSKAKQFINNATTTKNYYDNIRDILSQDMVNYPQDYQIKELQRLAENKYDKIIEDSQNKIDNILNYFDYHNKNLTKTQYEKLQELKECIDNINEL